MTTQHTDNSLYVVKVTSMDKVASKRLWHCWGMDKPVATFRRQQCISHRWSLSTSTRTQEPGTSLRWMGFVEPTQKWPLQDDTHYISGERERRRPATTAANNHRQLSTSCRSVLSHSSLAVWRSYINYKTKKPLIVYQDGARHTKSKVK